MGNSKALIKLSCMGTLGYSVVTQMIEDSEVETHSRYTVVFVFCCYKTNYQDFVMAQATPVCQLTAV